MNLRKLELVTQKTITFMFENYTQTIVISDFVKVWMFQDCNGDDKIFRQIKVHEDGDN